MLSNGCEVGGSDLLKGCHSDRALHVPGSRRGEYALSYLSYLSDDDPSYCMVLYLGTEAIVAVTNEVNIAYWYKR